MTAEATSIVALIRRLVLKELTLDQRNGGRFVVEAIHVQKVGLPLVT
jgi:predicted transcriptional regulator